jgi:membrane protease YdiL (CAAX protease family)
MLDISVALPAIPRATIRLMNDQPVFLLLMGAAGVYVFHLWRQDYLADRRGKPVPHPLPGATPASTTACFVAAAGALTIVALETWGEIRLGISDQQSNMTLLFGLYTLVAAFIEELIFRGFIVIEGKGTTLRWLGVVAASVIFAGLHPFLWSWDIGETSSWHVAMIWRWSEWFTWEFNAKGWFSTAAVFVSSLWFYTVRFAKFNPKHSLLPCIVAHATKNLGVFGVKAVQGFVSGWW